MTIVSIDPGLDGGIAIFEDGKLIEKHSMPTVKIETQAKLEQLDLKHGKKQFIKAGPNKGKPKMKLRRAAKSYKDMNMYQVAVLMEKGDVIVIEHQQPRPGNGSAQCAKTMFNYGRLMGLAYLTNVEIEVVRPQLWKADLHITMTKDEKKVCGSASLVTKTLKAKACSLAKHLYPKEEFVSPKGKLMDGIAESVLIGHHYINYIEGKSDD